MAEAKEMARLNHRSRVAQVPIFLGKQLRSFVYMSDWKILPMAAVIAALVSMVVRRDYFVTMEGTLKGSFALTCVAIWNGCFNSIQVICRERGILKREHRSGLHVSAYIFSHMVYQMLLCLAQTAVTLAVCSLAGIKFPEQGCVTPFMITDVGITLFLITYASDMVSLLVSALVHSTTAAMTVMPFVLIFQLVFSGGIFTLPSWATKISDFTISNYGLKCMMAAADYNSQPMVTGWNTLLRLEDDTFSGTITVGRLMDLATDENGLLSSVRKIVLVEPEASPASAAPESTASPGSVSSEALTVGDLIDLAAQSEQAKESRDTELTYSVRIGDVIDTIGRDRLQGLVMEKTAASMQKEDYSCDPGTIWGYWFILILFALLFAGAAVVSLKFIDKDKR